VIYERRLPQEELDEIADAVNVPRHDANELGYLNNRELEFPNEPARHKLLDIIGDMALVGSPSRDASSPFAPGIRSTTSWRGLFAAILSSTRCSPPSTTCIPSR